MADYEELAEKEFRARWTSDRLLTEEDNFLEALDQSPLLAMDLLGEQQKENSLWHVKASTAARASRSFIKGNREANRKARYNTTEFATLDARIAKHVNEFAKLETAKIIELSALYSWVEFCGIAGLADENAKRRQQGIASLALPMSEVRHINFGSTHHDSVFNEWVECLNPDKWTIWGIVLHLVRDIVKHERLTPEVFDHWKHFATEFRRTAEFSAHVNKWLKKWEGEKSIRARIVTTIGELDRLWLDFISGLEKLLDEVPEPFELRTIGTPAQLLERQLVQLWIFYLKHISGLSFSALAEAASMSKSTVSRYMANAVPRYRMRYDNILRLTNAAINLAKPGVSGDLVDGHAMIFFPHFWYNVDEKHIMEPPWQNVSYDDILRVIAELVETCDDVLMYDAFMEYSDWAGFPEEDKIKFDVDKSGSVSIYISGASEPIGAEDDIPEGANIHPVQHVPIIGCVEAGLPQTAQQFEGDVLEYEPILPIDNQRYGPDAFGLIVRGDSMDQVFSNGSVLICRKLLEEDSIPDLINRYVIAENPQQDTDFYEATCKQLLRDEYGSLVLMPRSNNPDHKPIQVGQYSDVRITAVVIEAHIKF